MARHFKIALKRTLHSSINIVRFLFNVIKSFVSIGCWRLGAVAINQFFLCSIAILLNEAHGQHWDQQTRCSNGTSYEIIGVLVQPVVEFWSRQIQTAQNSCSRGTVCSSDFANVNTAHFPCDVSNLQDVAADVESGDNFIMVTIRLCRYPGWKDPMADLRCRDVSGQVVTI